MTVNAIIVVGPTGVGKSRWALEYAQKHGGTIINADSQQCYQACPILTARPSQQDEVCCPHLGYGVLPPDVQTTVGWWLKAMAPHIEQAELPIIVGGTGMYVEALLNGLSDIPSIEVSVLERVAEFCHNEGWAQRVRDIDPALPVMMQDPQRLKRALAVLWQTGKSITEFWQERTYAVPNLCAHVVVVDAPLEVLAPRLGERFRTMVRQGAIEEVKAFQHQPESAYQGIACALGFGNLMAYIKGEMLLDVAIEQTQRDTRLYAKRQRTWFRNRIKIGPRVAQITQLDMVIPL